MANSLDDDDGIIDLNAMAPKSVPPRAPVTALFTDTPTAVAVDAPDRPADAKGAGLRMGLIIGGGAIVAILMVVGIAFAFRGEKATPRTAAAIVAPPAVSASPPLSASAATEPPPATASDDSSEGESKPGAKKRHHGGGGKHPTGAAHTPAAAAAPAKPVKAADPCHCHGDFQCNIKCSAGR